MSDNVRNLINLIEASSKKELVLEKLPYARTALTPVLSKSSIDYHYGELAKGYVDRFNRGEGDKKFNEAGAFLHNIFFPQLMASKSGNKPSGISLSVINKKYGSFDEFKKELKQVAMKIQGSGWVYMSKNGEIKTITNHQIKNDIALLIDWWEHAWAKDYGANKSKYLENIWRIINWDKVNARMY
jgi:Fe-Mn family superoxide dismutase